jgi:hypothetical protein
MGWGEDFWGSSFWGGAGNVTPVTTASQLINSTTYADLLGLQLGLQRLLGETSRNYIKRLEAASVLKRDHPYEGALNEVNLQLGTIPSEYIHVDLAQGQIITVSIAGIVIDSNPVIPLLEFDSDSMWNFRMLSDVVRDINLYVPATLLVTDSPAFQLARQSNSLWSVAEEIAGIQTQLLHSGVQQSTVSFNQPVPAFTLTSGGLLTFLSEPTDGTEITYNYIVTPYDLIGSPVALIGLKDPEFAQVAATNNSVIAYQVSEIIQSIMSTDRSYWAN